MTYEEFYELLPLDQWFVDGRGRIRRGSNEDEILTNQCPITAAVGAVGSLDIYSSACHLGLTTEQVDSIMWAADQPDRAASKEIRRQLLARLSLQEQP